MRGGDHAVYVAPATDGYELRDPLERFRDRRRAQAATPFARRAGDTVDRAELELHLAEEDLEQLYLGSSTVHGRPVSAGCAWFGLLACIALAAAVVILLAAAPRSTAVIPPAGTSEEAKAPASAVGVEASATPGGPGQRSIGASWLADAQALGPRAAAPVRRSLEGWATYCGEAIVAGRLYCEGWSEPDAYLGAVPTFRFGDEPYIARVWRTDVEPVRTVDVWIVSYCACDPRDGIPTVVDLSPAAFEELARLHRGRVIVELEDLRPAVTLPPTDTEGGD